VREQIISRLADTRLPPSPATEAAAEVENHVLAAWFRMPLREAAVLIPLVERTSGIHVLYTERRHDLPEHPGQISFPGGRAEPDDDDLGMTALREAHEEIGLRPDAVQIAGYMPAQAIITGYAAVPVVGFVPGNFAPEPDAREVAAVFEVPLEFLLDPANAVRDLRVRDGVELPMWEYHWGSHRIWGATALMTYNFIKVIK
jgi:8-oxo-dGTP pyrophosphatase MutT (NUDIX family)